ncbi:MAG: alkaline shock response membrane anchor protein AmaP [Anaerolineae bacterium]|nr:alkaline shock response membrane anchor protein AmaP [Anaerolineae bacterium]
MNVFNRIIMVIGILLWIVLLFFVAIRPLDAVAFARAQLDCFEKGIFEDQFFSTFLMSIGAIELVLIVLLWLELRRTRRKTVWIKTKGGGRAQLGIQSISQSLEYRIDELPGVRKVQAHVLSRGKDVKVRIDLDTSPSVNIPVLTDQIVDLCRDIVEKQLGVKIHGKVEVYITHEPYPRGTMPPTGPLGQEPVVAPPSTVPGAGAPSGQAPAKVPSSVETEEEKSALGYENYEEPSTAEESQEAGSESSSFEF